ncbi:MAG: NAD(P)H-hydrate epimerase [Acidimicrobiia bacterium]|nr:NAD(P)H-hydrate epimerase [Acidimicrobiia bacterium]MDH3471353.1 NAD(P)H-hydrate epimerase [Acidimicrobiia bacterium]
MTDAIRADGLPALTAQQMAEVDRIMIEDLGIELLQMMENAGRNLAMLALERFEPASVVVLAGSGGNGGGGIAAARHLSNRGASVAIVVGQDRDRLAQVTTKQLDIAERIGIAILEEPQPAELIVDALIGYSLTGDPRGRKADLIEWANAGSAPILALDTPSGLDVTTGQPANLCISAIATMTIAMPKAGLLGAPQVGELYLADISVPPSVYEGLGFVPFDNPFRRQTVVRLLA